MLRSSIFGPKIGPSRKNSFSFTFYFIVQGRKMNGKYGKQHLKKNSILMLIKSKQFRV